MSESIVGLPDGRVRLLPYSPEWKGLFADEARRIADILGPYVGPVVREIQHVGSTSIPGIPAKPIIDIGVAVTDFESAKPCIERLQEAGYTYLGENEVPGRHFFYLGAPTTTGRTHHLHMFKLDSREWRETIGFRDYLRNHPAVAEAYGEIKTELASTFPNDRPGYLAGKAPFIRQVLRLAVPENPLLWTTIRDGDMGASFDFSQEVAGQPVEIEISRSTSSRRIRLLTPDRRALYFELTVYDGPLEVTEAHDRFVHGLHQHFHVRKLTELHQIILGTYPAWQFGFTGDTIRREVIFIPQATRLLRVILDPLGPLNWAMLNTLTWTKESGLPG